MGTDTLLTATDGTVIPADNHNSIKGALTGDHVPRNTSGVPTDNAGDLGTSTYGWDNAHIEKIYQAGAPSDGDVMLEGSAGGTVWGSYQSQEFLTGGTFTVPSGVSRVHIVGMGGGGGGGGGVSSSQGAGGGGGARWCAMTLAVTPSESITVTIGAGGGSNANGGVSTFGDIRFPGGYAGAVGPGGNGGLSPETMWPIQSTHGSGGRGGQVTVIGSQPGSTGYKYHGFSGSVAGGTATNDGSHGGGGGGGSFGIGGNGNSGSAPANSGGGGGGAAGTAAGGSGGSGRVIVYWMGE